MMALLVGPLGLVLIGATLFDAFETIVVPRRVSRRLRLADCSIGLPGNRTHTLREPLSRVPDEKRSSVSSALSHYSASWVHGPSS
jgi:hypothetical protein